MKTAAVLINIDNQPFADLSVKANQKYYSHFGIELRQIKGLSDKAKNYKPKWMASIAFDVFPDLDFVIVQDLDIIPCNLKYNIMDFLMLRELNFAKSYTRIGMKITTAPFPYFQYNAGLFAYNKHFQEMFDSIFQYGKDDPENFGTCDQYYINKYIGENSLYVNEIPMIFNTFYHSSIDFDRVAFCHYTNSLPSECKLDFIEQYHPKEMLC